MKNEQYEFDKRTAIMSGMTVSAATAYADKLQEHPSRGGTGVLAALDRSSNVAALDSWAAAHELGTVHLQHRRSFGTCESVFQVVLTARDSLDLVSSWRSTPDEARQAMVMGLQEVCAKCLGSGRITIEIKNEAGEADHDSVECDCR